MGRMEDPVLDPRHDPRGLSASTPGGSAFEAKTDWQDHKDSMSPIEFHDWQARQSAELALVRSGIGGAAVEGVMSHGPGVDHAVATVEDAKLPPRGAFGAFVKPEQYDPYGDHDFAALTEAQKNWFTPGRLRRILLHPPEGVPHTVFRSEDHTKGRVALNSYEYTLLSRNPLAMAQAVEARNQDSHDVTDETTGTARRSADHALESKREDMTEHAEKLAEVGRDLAKLRFAQSEGVDAKSNNINKAMMSPQEMARLTSVAWNEFITILDVVHKQRGWNDVQRESAEASLANYLTQGSQPERVAHWQDMTDLAKQYAQLREVVFKNRIRQTDALLAPESASA